MHAPIVLVVDDNAITRKLVRITLSRAGYEVLEAEDGRTALKVLVDQKPDLILQDLILPDIGGLELVRKLRGEPAGAEIPILAVSGFQSELELGKKLGVGFTDFLFKPVEPSRLVETVQAYLPIASAGSVDVGQQRHILMVDDDPVQLKLARLRLEHQGFRVKTASDGEEALAKLHEWLPDAVVSDVLMPGIDGFRLCLLLKQDAALSHIPVVLTSCVYTDAPDRDLARQVGAFDLVLRTGDLKEVLDALTAALSQPAPLTVPTGDPLSTAGYFERVVHQLEQQAERNRMHARRLSWLETELAILGELPGQSESGQSLLDLLVELLQRCLDGSGLSSGAIFLLNSAGELEQAAELGMTRAAKQRGGVDAATCTVLLGRVEPEGKSLLISSTSSEGRENAELLHRLGAQSVLVTPLHDADQLRGAMVLVSSRDELGEDWAAFASAIGHQMTRVILQAQDRARLEESEERYRHLAESAPIGIFEADLENRYQYVNPCWEQLSGWSLAETLGYGWQRAFRAEDVPALGELGFQATEGHPSSRDLLLVRPDGSECWVSVSISLRRAPNGAPAAFVGTVADISEQNRAEEALHHSEELLRQAQKMEAVGNLAGGIAHDFNNLLTAIIGFGQMGLNDEALSPAVRTYLEEVVRAGERAAILTGQLLAFSRRQVLRPETIDVNVAVADMGRLLSRVIGANVRLDTVLASEAPLVHADPGQIEQVILNLAVNARDAMPGGGHISIETHALEVDEERAAEYGVAPGPYVRIAVTDTGSGIAAEHLAKIFEPFFTTKPQGEGTGMGLATVYGIVKQSAGHIAVYSEVGRGTTFNIYLPRIEGTASAKEPSTPVVEALERGETVLLVEDEVGVRSLAQAVLEGAGYTVLVTEQPDQALALLKTHEGHIHLLLTDVVMPGMSGPDLAARVVESRPDIKVMFMSGYPGDALKLQGGIASDAAYLQKPFRPSGLRQKVREVLDALPT